MIIGEPNQQPRLAFFLVSYAGLSVSLFTYFIARNSKRLCKGQTVYIINTKNTGAKVNVL